jgi:hypothetical protein
MHITRCLTATLLGALVAACGNANLSRSRAAAEIAASVNGPAGSVRIFRTRCVERDVARYPLVFYEDNRIVRQYRSLEAAGLVTVSLPQPTPEACGTPYLEHKELIEIALTAKGAAEKWPEHAEGVGGWDIVLGHREFLDVTGIETAADATSARADFTFHLVPTAGGAALSQTSSPLRGTATFERGDEGWRLVRKGY